MMVKAAPAGANAGSAASRQLNALSAVAMMVMKVASGANLRRLGSRYAAHDAPLAVAMLVTAAATGANAGSAASRPLMPHQLSL